MIATSAPLSMVNPSTDAMLKKIHSRYTLVVLASKRARKLLNDDIAHNKEVGGKELVARKYVTEAMEEIDEGKITYHISGEV